MAVNFYLEKRVDKNGDAQIRVSITIRGTRLVTTTGLKSSTTKWNKDKQRVKQGASNASGHTYNTINATLTRIEDFFNQYELQCAARNVSPTTDDIKREYAKNFVRIRKTKALEQIKPEVSFFDIYDHFTKEMGTANQWTRATHQKFNALKNHLTRFDEDVTFADFTQSGLNRFVTFLREDLDMKNSTIGKQLGFLKWFLRWAFAKGYHSNIAYQTFSPKLKTAGKKVIFLDWDELMKVYNYEMPDDGAVVTLHDADGNPYEKTVHASASTSLTRDIFCFCCFTSLRYSDAANLKRADIEGDTFTITTIKTADTITIDINKFAHAILDKYSHRDDTRGFVFPRITNQRMNRYLKELCELCGINQRVTQIYYRGSERIEETSPKYELIGTHCGRRTFICNALMLGIPAEIVMKWTGHSDYKAMKPYIAIADAAKAKAMSLFDRL